jgi:hypothetical protein
VERQLPANGGAKLPKEHALNAPELEVVMQLTVSPAAP